MGHEFEALPADSWEISGHTQGFGTGLSGVFFVLFVFRAFVIRIQSRKRERRKHENNARLIYGA
jgi:hypothetical protein